MRLLTIPLLLTMGCPVAIAYDVPDQPKCVIDSCNDNLCNIETPEGWVQVLKEHDYYEGKRITCPTWLVEPT